MTSFPVDEQSLITRKRCEIEQKFQLTTYSKSESDYQNTKLKLKCAPHGIEIGVTSFPVCTQSLITRKRCEIEQKL